MAVTGVSFLLIIECKVFWKICRCVGLFFTQSTCGKEHLAILIVDGGVSGAEWWDNATRFETASFPSIIRWTLQKFHVTRQSEKWNSITIRFLCAEPFCTIDDIMYRPTFFRLIKVNIKFCSSHKVLSTLMNMVKYKKYQTAALNDIRFIGAMSRVQAGDLCDV